MEKYILSLLKENNRVIIPEFGAFIIRQQNPPEIAFNGLLTFNDGILTEYVSHHAGISFLEASTQVSDYAEKLKTDLKLHNRLTFNEIGWVWIDDWGEKQFTPWKEGRSSQSETRTGQKDIETILKEAELTVKSEANVPSDSPVITSGEQVPFTLDDTVKDADLDPSKDILQKKSPEEGVISGDISAESFSLEDSVKPETEDAGKPVPEDAVGEADKQAIVSEETTVPPIPETGKTIPSQHKKSLEQIWQENEVESAELSRAYIKKKKRSWIIPVVIIGIIVILAGASWLTFPDQVKNFIFPDRQIYQEAMSAEEADEGYDLIVPADDSNEQTADQESVPDMDEQEVPAESETPVIRENLQSTGNRYYVVAGCFKSRLNAEKYVAELRDRGFNAELFGTHDNLYAVSFNSFSSREQAVTEMNRIKETVEPRAWVLFY
jgi:cell division septation protein DedD